jgi:hypothetical protein
MITPYTMEKDCEVCHGKYEGTRFDESTCVPCRRVRALERIADVLEYWVGLQ